MCSLHNNGLYLSWRSCHGYEQLHRIVSYVVTLSTWRISVQVPVRGEGVGECICVGGDTLQHG